LISAAEATNSLRVGTNVLNNDFRHPVLVAREAATVDLLTEGRLQLGLGAGYMQSEYEQTGLDLDAGRIRVERLAEAVTLIKGLLKGEQRAFWAALSRDRSHDLSPSGPAAASPHSDRRQWSTPPHPRCAGGRHCEFVRDHLPPRWCGPGHFRVESVGGRQAHAAGARRCRRRIRTARTERAGATRGRDGSSPPGGRGIGGALDPVKPRRDPAEPLCADRHGGQAN
jgi:luciferase-like monooxygenase